MLPASLACLSLLKLKMEPTLSQILLKVSLSKYLINQKKKKKTLIDLQMPQNKI
jgi:hypothetical protein